MTIQPWTETGALLCLTIFKTPTITAETVLKKIALKGIEMRLIQGASGESVHTFAHTPENVLEVGKIIKAKRKRPGGPAIIPQGVLPQ